MCVCVVEDGGAMVEVCLHGGLLDGHGECTDLVISGGPNLGMLLAGHVVHACLRPGCYCHGCQHDTVAGWSWEGAHAAGIVCCCPTMARLPASSLPSSNPHHALLFQLLCHRPAILNPVWTMM